MKKEMILGAALVLGLGLASCKKKGCTDETAVNYEAGAKKDDGSCVYDEDDLPAYTADFKSLYNDYREAATQEFTIDPTVYNMIEGTDGVKLEIPAGTFVDASGTPVTSSVTVSLLEVLDDEDMILMGAPTMSEGSLLITGGELRAEASSGGAPVFASTPVGLYVPTIDPDMSMDIFDGVEDPSTGDITWTSSTDSLDIIIVTDSTGLDSTSYYYYSWADSTLGWINCDYFWDDPSPKSDLIANVSGDHGHTNTQIFLHFPTISSIGMMYAIWSDADNNSYQINNLPIGLEMNIVAISEISGTYYSAIVPITLTDGHEEDLTLGATTLAEFEAAIAAL
ncbi:MAG: hypothetical protein MK078_10840 [Crocinitomicaceae bacterium]|nr:hypothetical protein [Crocinitomicaceae bacterium]